MEYFGGAGWVGVGVIEVVGDFVKSEHPAIEIKRMMKIKTRTGVFIYSMIKRVRLKILALNYRSPHEHHHPLVLSVLFN